MPPKENEHEPGRHRGPQTRLITGVQPGHTSWRLLRWLLFLAAMLSVVCGGFLLSVRSSEVNCEYQVLAARPGFESLRAKAQSYRNVATDVAAAFRNYWMLFVLILAAVFTFFELVIHSRWKIYAIYALIALAAWVFVLYSLNLLKIPEELTKSGGG
jgi:hypothetical protein